MDELEISGKRYISAKRIAKENKYHPDYVGQLIRAGRVRGTKVGRAWYVDEASFIEYLGKERGEYAPLSHKPVPPQHAEIKSFVESVQNRPAVSPEPREIFVRPEPEAAFQQPQEVPPARKFFVEEAPVVEKKPAPKTSLTYLADNSPLFPAIQRRTSSENLKKPIDTSDVTIRKEEYIAAEPFPVQESAARKGSPWKTGFAILSLVVVAGVFFTFAFFGSIGIDSTIFVEQGKPASVAFSQEKTLCFIFGDCQNSQNSK